MKPDTAFPGILTLIGLAVLIALIATCSGCGSEYPITLSVYSDHGKASYSRQRGIEIQIDATK